jgi:cytochrome c551
MRIWTLAALAGTVLIGCGDKDDDSGATDGTDGGSLSTGEDLYAANCTVCHGDAGLGEEETGFTGASDLTVRGAEMTETEIVDVILNGDGGMPAIAVTEAEASDIAAYVKANFGS